MRKRIEFITGCEHCNVRIKSVFNSLESEELKDMSKHKLCSTFKKGQFVFTENGIPSGFFV
jgi:hypothetical protein